MYLFWNFDISQESSAYPNFRELPRKKTKIHLGGYPSSLEDAQGSSTGEGTSHQKWTTIIAAGSPMISFTFPGPSLQWSTSPVQRRRKKGFLLWFVVQWWKWVGQNLWKFVIHHHTYCRFCVLLPHICVQFVLYMYISYHSSHIFQYAQDLSDLFLRRSSERTYLPSCSINLGSMPWLQQLGSDHNVKM